MTLYQNGRIPLDKLILLDSGTDANGYWEHRLSAGTAAKLKNAQAYAQRKWGRSFWISHGWNGYRPLNVQADARTRACAEGNCNAAADPGYSSHGGTWIDSVFTGGKWVDALAVDIDPNGLTWAQVDEAMQQAGFLIHGITVARAGRSEPWHYIDLDPWRAVPAGGDPQPFTPTKEDKVKSYHRQDALSRSTTGRTLQPGASAYLDTDPKAAPSNASNIIGGVGVYDIVGHVYAQGTPGDVVSVVAVVQTDPAGKPSNSNSYTKRMVLDAQGQLQQDAAWALDLSGVTKPTAVYLQVIAPKSNKGPVKITVLDTDAHLFIAA